MKMLGTLGLLALSSPAYAQLSQEDGSRILHYWLNTRTGGTVYQDHTTFFEYPPQSGEQVELRYSAYTTRLLVSPSMQARLPGNVFHVTADYNRTDVDNPENRSDVKGDLPFVRHFNFPEQPDSSSLTSAIDDSLFTWLGGPFATEKTAWGQVKGMFTERRIHPRSSHHRLLSYINNSSNVRRFSGRRRSR